MSSQGRVLERGVAGRAGEKGKRGRAGGDMREKRGLSDAHIGQEGGGHCCGLYQLPPAHTVPVPSYCPRPALLLGLATLTATTIVAALSAAASFLIFLPAPDRAADGDGKQLPCPATSLL